MMNTIIIVHDGTIDIATANTSKAIHWKNKPWLWSEFVSKISVTQKTHETYKEYINGKKAFQGDIKNVGGFVGAFLTSGRRKKGSVLHRQLLTLDIDHLPANQPGALWDEFQALYGEAACLYSTHKHSPETPRYRLILPLDREVGPDEYQAIARRIAGNLGIENFDHTTFEPERLMYWPSTSKDGEFVFQYQDGKWLSADDTLNSYRDWKDTSQWPMSEGYNNLVSSAIKKQGDPLEKEGVVGAWCRTYDIDAAIEKFLPDVYTVTDVEDRYTYTQGSTSAGLVVYEDKYTYSHHGTDPTSMKLCNAFDLVRIHKYGHLDTDIKEDTPMNKLPSYIAMRDFANNDPLTKDTIISETFDFDEDQEQGTPENNEWKKSLKFEHNSKSLCRTLANTVLILSNAPGLKGCIALDEFSQSEILAKPWPWQKDEPNSCNINDIDISCLKHYLETKWKLSVSKDTINDALQVVLQKNKVHPLKEYLSGLSWDGKTRVDNLLIDYFGAEDSDYVKAVTRKSLCAAVARIFEPGKKFDYMLILIGEQGKGKSTLFALLGRDWYSDSFNFHMLKNGKDGSEQLQGMWIMEIGELVGLSKADLEGAKSFLSRLEDRYRVPYDKRVKSFPRQCVFFGTTNQQYFLRDPTGNRRFWPVTTGVTRPTKDIFKDLTPSEVDQIWAEVLTYYQQKEKLYLPPAIESVAQSIQQGHTEQDERRGAIIEYLEMLLPDNWDEMELSKRRNYVQGDELQPPGTKYRETVCGAEIWCELFGGNEKDLSRYNTKFIHDIMQNLPGWERLKSNRTFALYGPQRAYQCKRQIEQNTDNPEL